MHRIDELMERYPALKSCRSEIENAAEELCACFAGGGKLLICGNGGSAADAIHIAGELLKGFLKKRPLSPEKKEAMRRASPGIPEETPVFYVIREGETNLFYGLDGAWLLYEEAQAIISSLAYTAR